MISREKGLLLIGGASRNVGKTSFACMVIEEFSKKYSIIGLKIKTIYEGDSFFHGKDKNPLVEGFKLIEELDADSAEDTGKMLNAGAIQVFRLKVKSESLFDAFNYFKKQVSDKTLIICESNSLRKVVVPDLYLLIKHGDGQNMKPSAKEMEQFADRIIYTDGKKHDFESAELEVHDNLWNLKPGT